MLRSSRRVVPIPSGLGMTGGMSSQLVNDHQRAAPRSVLVYRLSNGQAFMERMVYHWRMNKAVAPLMLTDDQRRTLEAWVRATNTPQGIALRAKIVLAAAGGAPHQRIAKELGTTRSTVSLWRGRFWGGGGGGPPPTAPPPGPRPPPP